MTTPNSFWRLRFLIIVTASTILGQELITAPFPADLSLELESEKPVFQTGEPITVFARIRNTGLSPLKVYRKLDTRYGTVEVEVSAQQNGPFAPYEGPGYGTSEVRPSTARLGPGQSIEDEIVLLANPSAGMTLSNTLPRFPFTEGNYWVRAIAHDPNSTATLISPPIEIQVRDPGDPVQREFAAKIADNPDLAEFLQTGDIGTSQDVVDVALDHLAKEDHSPTALAAATALGEYYRIKDPEKGLQWLRVVLSHSEPSSAIRNRAQLQAIHILMEHGQEGELRAVLNQASLEPKRPAFKTEWTVLKRSIERQGAIE